ncbi:DJ-1/PfpI family protein [Demequina aurantiaca]|uniref:DJ-1/PfpI family protein n=1 Tax=Demequina aurantiaca TaxID=676200 RepID=UPI0007808D3B|nr:DJ-1/PfpI family protein [Demequina aurantiaca]
MALRIGILLYDGFDLIDSGGPYEVFLTASRLAERDGDAALYDVRLISPQGSDVTAFGGMTVTGTTSAPDAGSLHTLIVPGLVDIEAARNDPAVGEAVASIAAASTVVASVCTGAFLLADQGLLEGRPATTHWEDVDLLASEGRIGSGVTDVRWVDTGAVVTSGGLTSGIHMALHLVERDYGREMAQRTARQLDVDWDPAGERSVR